MKQKILIGLITLASLIVTSGAQAAPHRIKHLQLGWISTDQEGLELTMVERFRWLLGQVSNADAPRGTVFLVGATPRVKGMAIQVMSTLLKQGDFPENNVQIKVISQTIENFDASLEVVHTSAFDFPEDSLTQTGMDSREVASGIRRVIRHTQRSFEMRTRLQESLTELQKRLGLDRNEFDLVERVTPSRRGGVRRWQFRAREGWPQRNRKILDERHHQSGRPGSGEYAVREGLRSDTYRRTRRSQRVPPVRVKPPVLQEKRRKSSDRFAALEDNSRIQKTGPLTKEVVAIPPRSTREDLDLISKEVDVAVPRVEVEDSAPRELNVAGPTLSFAEPAPVVEGEQELYQPDFSLGGREASATYEEWVERQGEIRRVLAECNLALE